MGGEGYAQPLACYRDYYTAMEEVKEDLQDSRYVERERETSKVAADPRWTPKYVLGSFQPSACAVPFWGDLWHRPAPAGGPPSLPQWPSKAPRPS